MVILRALAVASLPFSNRIDFLSYLYLFILNDKTNWFIKDLG